MQTKIKSLILLTSLTLVSLASAASVDVNANLPSGTYDHPISIELNITDSTAKTFYSFKPDGYPQDAYLYTGSLLLKSSTSLVFFSIVSPTNESKIKLNEYVFDYPTSIRFLEQDRSIDANASSVRLSIVNDGTGSVNIGYWQVQSEAELFEFEKDTMLSSGEKREVNIAYTGSSVVTLRSPDGDERSILVIHRDASTERQQVRLAPQTKRSINFVKLDEARWRQAVEKLATPQDQDTSTQSGAAENISDTKSGSTATPPVSNVTPIESVPAVAPIPTAPNPIIPANDIKVSVGEAQDRGIDPIYVIVLLGLLTVVGGARFVMTKKK